MTTGLNALALGISLLGAPGASALEVGLEVDPCLGLPEAEVRRLTELELATHVVPLSRGAELAATVRVSCLDDQASIRVTDPSSGKTLERTLDFASPARDVRARALALATVELLLAHWSELSHEAPPAVPEASPASAPTPKKSPSPPANATTPGAQTPPARRGSHVDFVLAFAQASSSFGLSDVAWGGGLRLGWVSRLRWLAADFELSAARGKRDTALGDVQTTTWSAAARPSVRLAERPLLVGIGLGARFGFARIEGTPSHPEQARGRVVAGSWGGPLAHAELGLALDHFFGCAGVEAGYALESVKGSVDGAIAAGVSGSFGSVTLGLGWAF